MSYVQIIHAFSKFSRQCRFLIEFHTAAKGDWVDAAKQEFESVQKALETIK